MGRNWLMKWDEVKNSHGTHRLTHRKRVTCELHELFPLDDDQTCDFKDRVDVELLHNSVKTVAVTVGDGVIDEMW